jgi:hypothetical protein
MKTLNVISLTLFAILLATCQSAPESITVTTNSEFTLSEGQPAEISDAGIAVTFISVSGDSRCPLGIECAASGPVTVSLSVRDQGGTESAEVLQTFTDIKGFAPEMEFEGIKDRIMVDGYQIKITSVLPYPQHKAFSIGKPDYQISLKVTKK